MKRKIITTGDGSKTIQIVEWDEQYHSKHGAINEAIHVFIKSGFHYYLKNLSPSCPVKILEIGFGTGLNALLTQIESEKLLTPIKYYGIEAYPVDIDEIFQLNYISQIKDAEEAIFTKLHQSKWEEEIQISNCFSLLKQKKFFSNIDDENVYDIIYFDAFGARVQPELWTKEIFEIMYKALKLNGVLVTYAAIGQVKRDMKDLGFDVERIEGPPGKRHMLRATKI